MEGTRIVDDNGIPSEISGKLPSSSGSKVVPDTVDISEDRAFIDQAIRDAPVGMSRFQIERFLIGNEPPVGRYFQACTEIKARERALRGFKEQLKSLQPEDVLKREELETHIENITKERDIFIDLAKEWKPVVEDHTFEEVQEEYWEQNLGYKLAIRLVTGQPIGDLIEPIIALPRHSKVRMLLYEIGKNKEIDHEKVDRLIEDHAAKNVNP